MDFIHFLQANRSTTSMFSVPFEPPSSPYMNCKDTVVSKAQRSTLHIESDDMAQRKGIERLLLLLFRISGSFAHLEVNNILEKYSCSLCLLPRNNCWHRLPIKNSRIFGFQSFLSLQTQLANSSPMLEWKPQGNNNIFL